MHCPHSLADEATLGHRFDIYEDLRRDAPVHVDPITGFYVVSNHADIRAIAMDTRRFSNKTNMLVGRSSGSSEEIAGMFREDGFRQIDTLSSNDPPSHKGFRGIVDRAFRPARVAQMAEYMECIINELIDGFANDGSVDFVERYAVPLPMTVIADQMGVGRDRFGDFKRWSDAVIDTANVLATPERMMENARSIIELQQFLAGQFDQARAVPRDDIMSDIATATLDGRLLDMEEMISLAVTLLVAGNETTTNALGSAMLRMIETGAEDRLRTNPEIIPAFTEEVLRLDAPIQLLYRRTVQAVDVRGVTIPEGAIVQLVWGSANRDPARFADSSEFRCDRGQGGAQHMTFGFGIHFCVGNALARAEINATLRLMTARLENFRVSEEPGAIMRLPHPIAFGPRRLRLLFQKRLSRENQVIEAGRSSP